MSANCRLVAIQVGELIKGSVSVNEIDRAAQAALFIEKDSFPNESITAVRAKTVYDWVLSLARASLIPEERDRRLVQFCRQITPDDRFAELERILSEAGVSRIKIESQRRALFEVRRFHSEVVSHSRRLFVDGNFFHAVFEAAKAYNKAVRSKAQTEKDGQSLMLEVWGCDKGVLKITPCESETDRNVQDGIKFLSAGLMQAIRNPTAHEPALHWPISEDDCLDVLHFVSFLFRKLDEAVFIPRTVNT
jgi:uncharacterized protein (TIGR02391 family)